jgi:hypothetical protein
LIGTRKNISEKIADCRVHCSDPDLHADDVSAARRDRQLSRRSPQPRCAILSRSAVEKNPLVKQFCGDVRDSAIAEPELLGQSPASRRPVASQMAQHRCAVERPNIMDAEG